MTFVLAIQCQFEEFVFKKCFLFFSLTDFKCLLLFKVYFCFILFEVLLFCCFFMCLWVDFGS